MGSPVTSDDEDASDGWSTPPDPDVDIANTHADNRELKRREAWKSCFEIFSNLESLWDKSSRDCIGSMPSKWRNEAIPLFEHGSTGYQLHLSYTWMKAIHTYSSADSDKTGLDRADWYLHGLARDTGRAGIDIVQQPLFVIPLGKLFINKDGHSAWTGYEMFVSNDLKVWIIYVPDKDNSIIWDTADSGLFASSGEQPNQTGMRKLAQFWPSLKDLLQSATFEEVRKIVRSPGRGWDITDRFYLLEISTRDIESLEKSYDARVSFTKAGLCVGLISDRIKLADGLAAHKLLLLAKENPKNSIVKLVHYLANSHTFYRDFDNDFYQGSLLQHAVQENDHHIVDTIVKSRDISAFANESDFDDLDMLANADQFEMNELVNLILDRIKLDMVRYNTTPFLIAVWRCPIRVIKLLLRSKKVEVNRQVAGTMGTPLDVARRRLEEATKANEGGEENGAAIEEAENIICMLEEYQKEKDLG
ncbi:hypothetical protein F5B18DRAFT_450397 [Nemania serpens]|nr:hypothetical protein F5B18DRAFT_450397 [Nemania serpens]